MSLPTLFIGNKNYSSWSLRPWLALRWAGIPFEEVVIPLGGPGYGQAQIPAIMAISPSGRVPALRLADGTVVWDSLAIVEWAAEQRPSLWPDDPAVRAVARSVTAEMHSGYTALRRDLSMNIRRRVEAPSWPDDTRADIARVLAVWKHCRETYGSSGPFLFGRRSCADAFFAPVATRFRTYSVPLPAFAVDYSEALFSDPDYAAWEAAGLLEVARIEATEALYR